jgi:hypothetical protein
MEVSGQLHAPAALSPGKSLPGPVWTTWGKENSWSYRNSNFDPSVVQPVVSRYTDYAIPTPFFMYIILLFTDFTQFYYNIKL